MSFATSKNSPGVALQHYLQHAAAVVRLSCLDCRKSRDFAVRTIIDGLKARGEGSERTGIRAVAALTHKPCPSCGGRRFESTPAFPAKSVRNLEA